MKTPSRTRYLPEANETLCSNPIGIKTPEAARAENLNVVFDQVDPLTGDAAYDTWGPLFEEAPLGEVETAIRNHYFVDS